MALTVAELIAKLRLDTDAFSASLKSVESSTDKTFGKIKSAGADMSAGIAKHSEAITMVSTRLLAIGAAATTGFTVAAKQFADFEDKIARAVGALGGGKKEIEEFSSLARQMGVELGKGGVTANNAAEALFVFASAGLNAKQSQEALRDTLTLAAATQMDLTTVSEITLKTMTAFGIKTADVARVTNVLAAANQAALGDITDIGSAMRQAAPVAAAMGRSLEETTAAIATMMNAGLLARSAGVGLRNIMVSIAQGGKALSSVLEENKIKLDEINPATHSLAEIFKVFSERQLSAGDAAKAFGKENVAAFLNLQKAGGQALDEMTQKLTGTQAAMEQFTIQTSTSGASWRDLKAQIDEFVLTIGKAVVPVIQPILMFLTDLIKAFTSLPDSVKTTIVVVTALGGVLATVGGALGFLILQIPTIIAGLTALSSVGAVLAGPAGWIALAVAGLVALEASTGALSKTFRVIVNAINSAGSAIEAFLNRMGDAGEAMIKNFVEGIKRVASLPVEAVKGMLGKIRNLLPFSPAKEGPLADLDDAGLAFSTTFASGIDAGRRFVTGSVERLARDAELALPEGGLAGAFFLGFEDRARSANTALVRVAAAGRQVFEELRSGFSDILFEGIIDGIGGIERAFKDFGKRLLRIFTDVFAQILIKEAVLALGLGSLLTGSASVAGAAGIGGAGSIGGGGGILGLFGGGGGGFGIGNLLSSLFGGLNSVIDWGLTQIFDLLTQGGTSFLGFGGSAAAGLAGEIIGSAVPVIGTAIAVITNLLQGNIRGASLIGAGALIGSFIPGIGTAIGAIIGGLIDFFIGLFEGGPTARIWVQLQSTFMSQQERFMAGLEGTIGGFVSADLPEAESRRIFQEIADALNAIVRQMMQAVITASTHLPSSLTEIINARLAALAQRGPFLLFGGDREFDLEDGAPELKAAIEALPNQVIKLFSEAIFGGLDLATLQKPGEELGDTFARVLNSMVGLTQVVDLLGGDIEALVQSMGTGDEALAAFVQGSIAFFDQFAKEGEKFEDTLKRVMEGIGGLIQVGTAIDAKIAELTSDTDLAISIMVDQLAKGRDALIRMADQLTIAIESGGAPDEVLKLAQALFEGRVKQFQAEIQFVQQIKGAVDQLRGAMLGALDTLGTILVASERFGGGGGNGQSLHPRLQFLAEGITLFRDLAGNVSGQIAVLNNAFQVLVGVLDGMIERGAQFGELADVFNIGFGTIHDGIVDILNTIQGLADPAQAVGALQQLGQAIIAGFDGAINTAKEFFDRQRSLAQDAASERIAQLNDERQAIQDSFSDQRSAIQDQRSLIEDRFKIERDALNEQIELTRQWASVLESVENQLRDLFNLMAPTQPLTSLQAVQDQFRAAFAAFQAGPTPELAQQVQTLGQQVIELAKGVPGFDLPSLAFQGVVDEVTAALEAIRSVAEAQPNEQDLLAQIAGIEQVQADSLASLDAQLAALDAAQQAALRGIDAQIVAVNQELQATLAALSQQEQEVIRFLEASAVAALDAVRVQLVARLAELQVAELQAAARLQEILGDKTFDEFIAGKQAQMVEQLSAIDATLKRYLGDITNRLFPGAGVPTAQFGMDYVPRTGPVLLHQGEMVLPRGEAEGVRRGEGEATVVVNLGGITVNAPGGGRVDAKRAVDEIEDELVRRFTFGKLRRPVLDITKRAPRA